MICFPSIQIFFLSEDIERIQKRALKIIVPLSSYGEALKITGISLHCTAGVKAFATNSLDKK
jgi:hypothetical protein